MSDKRLEATRRGRYGTRQISYYSPHKNRQIIGKGTYGEVTIGHKPDGGRVAIKKLIQNDRMISFPSIREIKLLQQMKHENIIELLEICASKGTAEIDEENEEQGRKEAKLKGDKEKSRGQNHRRSTMTPSVLRAGNIYLVLEYVENDLKGLLKYSKEKGVFLSDVARKTVMRQILEGVAYLHKHEIIHRDLKAANILVHNDWKVKIADFGLARKIERRGAYDEDEEEPLLTLTVMTLHYRAPEILLGNRNYGTAADMWSCGIILLELLREGNYMFDRLVETEMQMIQEIWNMVGSPSKETFTIMRGESKSDMSKLEPPASPGDSSTKLQEFFERNFPSQSVHGKTFDLLRRMLQLNFHERASAQTALKHGYFWTEEPKPVHPSVLPKIEGRGRYEHLYYEERDQKAAKAAARDQKAQEKCYHDRQYSDGEWENSSEVSDKGVENRKGAPWFDFKTGTGSRATTEGRSYQHRTGGSITAGSIGDRQCHQAHRGEERRKYKEGASKALEGETALRHPPPIFTHPPLPMPIAIAPFMSEQPSLSYDRPPPPLPEKPLTAAGGEGYVPGPFRVPFHASYAQFHSAFSSFQSVTSQISEKSLPLRQPPLPPPPQPTIDEKASVLQDPDDPSPSPSPYPSSSLSYSPSLSPPPSPVCPSETSAPSQMLTDNVYKEEKKRGAEGQQELGVNKEVQVGKGLEENGPEQVGTSASVEWEKEAEGVSGKAKDRKQEVLKELLTRLSPGHWSNQDSREARDKAIAKAGETSRHRQDGYVPERQDESDHSNHRSRLEEPDRHSYRPDWRDNDRGRRGPSNRKRYSSPNMEQNWHRRRRDGRDEDYGRRWDRRDEGYEIRRGYRDYSYREGPARYHYRR